MVEGVQRVRPHGRACLVSFILCLYLRQILLSFDTIESTLVVIRDLDKLENWAVIKGPPNRLVVL